MAKTYKKLPLLLILVVGVVAFFLKPFSVFGQSDTEKMDEIKKQISEYEQQVSKLNSQANTLSNQIAQYDVQIKLTTLKITQTEEKIAFLGGRIEQLQNSLTALSQAFASRAVETYKMTKIHEPFVMLVTSPNLASAFSSFHYLQRIQESDRELLVKLGDTQGTYQDEKVLQEELQEDLQSQKKTLDSQKTVKNTLLVKTKNDEKRYQQLLSEARAEYEAIQAITAGKGSEIEVGAVNQGDRIASIIQGPSCNSSGGHLHFIVSQEGVVQNPFSYLKPGIGFENCSGSYCGSGDGDAFNPAGNWDWPLGSPVKYSQGFGSTWAVRNTWVGKIYNFHNGIDINNTSDATVRAVKSGILHQGSYSGSNGCRLRYVRLDHTDSNFDTFYLHINY